MYTQDASPVTPEPLSGSLEPTAALDPQLEAGLSRLAGDIENTPAPKVGVLLIDDDDDDVYLLEEAFKTLDREIRIHRVKDGLQAIDYLEGRQDFSDRQRFPMPHLVLLDLALPAASGLHVLKHIRSNRSLQGTSVVMLTGSSDVKDAEAVFQLGVSAYLLKPRGSGGYIGIVRNLRSSALI
jgi:CheY-like chemotaxis protein